MTRTPDASADQASRRQRLLELLQAAAIDDAIDDGLMEYACDPAEPRDAPLAAMQAQLRDAWAARERYRARAARLARIERERQARRLGRTPAVAASAADPATAAPPPPSPALPPAVAAALARAKARAQERSSQ